MRGVHLGASGYKQTARNFHISADDFNWNLKYIPVVNEIGASLVYADYSFRSFFFPCLSPAKYMF